jgi:hypothetical protein
MNAGMGPAAISSSVKKRFSEIRGGNILSCEELLEAPVSSVVDVSIG